MESRIIKAVELSTNGEEMEHLTKARDIIEEVRSLLFTHNASEITFDTGDTWTRDELGNLLRKLSAFAICLDASWDKPLSVE